jgi:hypothetical protein
MSCIVAPQPKQALRRIYRFSVVLATEKLSKGSGKKARHLPVGQRKHASTADRTVFVSVTFQIGHFSRRWRYPGFT